MDNDQADRFADMIEAGIMDYDDTADLFLATDVGAFTGVDRTTLLALLRVHFPDRAALNTYLRGATAAYDYLRMRPPSPP